MVNIANRYGDVQEYYFSHKLREVAQLNASGKSIINLGIGSPDMAPPQEAVEALCAAAQQDSGHGYQNYKGIAALRQAFSDWYANYYAVALDPETEVLPLLGSKEGITYISNAYLNEGDEVLVPNPGYPAYAAATKVAGGVVRYYDLQEETGWLPDLEYLQQQDLRKVKLMWVNYPHMPTGAKASQAALAQLVDFAERNDILLCHDNPYSFILNDNPESILSVKGVSAHVLELNSLSKSHNMAGWRVGMLAGHSSHISNVLVAKSNVDSGMFLGIQQAAIEALKQTQTWFDNLNAHYAARRSIVWQLLDTLDCAYSTEQVGLFVWGRTREGVAVGQLVDELLYEAGVFITPGFIFGSNGDRYIRVSLCADAEQLQTALERIKAFKNTKIKST
ncbi:aminotransferase class I/II-fold pyridoxal phosphate-dependent enzyme [Pontibacter sp. BT731]|uniref:pyridoxal phosphate-dependent aminotransferase n=1 Tax=Pontibacter coccineus TaxID=3063328 RepID=UPI0026E436BA|nr:aminotransferase class I/II-fold pyridoxal phosphate-dependent enzyme [Pontibacter sp. BT731]MDO6391895.1 aminotransferase class I/II-fold pyridoxal phosphate-dependent enzyme [Pontibacter sp. BT731]